MKSSSQKNVTTRQPSKVVTTMHIYSTNNLKAGKINPQPTVSKQIQSRRKKSNSKAGQLYVEGKNISRVMSGKISPHKDLIISNSFSSNNLNAESKRVSQNNIRQKQQKGQGISAASVLFQEQKQRKMLKQDSFKPMNQQSSHNPQIRNPSRVSGTFGPQQFNSVPKSEKYFSTPLLCPYCKSSQCQCVHIGGSYKNCPHCSRQQFGSIKPIGPQNIESIQYLQDKILQMLNNDFNQF